MTPATALLSTNSTDGAAQGLRGAPSLRVPLGSSRESGATARDDSDAPRGFEMALRDAATRARVADVLGGVSDAREAVRQGEREDARRAAPRADEDERAANAGREAPTAGRDVNVAALHAQELASRGAADPLGLRAAVNAESSAPANTDVPGQGAARGQARGGRAEPAAQARDASDPRGRAATDSGGSDASLIDDAGGRAQGAGADGKRADGAAVAGERRASTDARGDGVTPPPRGVGAASAPGAHASSGVTGAAAGAERSGGVAGAGGARGADAINGLRALEQKALAARGSREADQSQAADRPRGALVAQEEPVAAQAVRGLSIALRQGGGTVMLRLEPELLGTLRVQLTIEHGVVAARIEASTREARELLERGVDTLRGALEARGLGVERIEIRPPEAGAEGGRSAFAGTADQQGLAYGGAKRDPGTDARGTRDGAGGGPRGATVDPGMDASGPGEVGAFWPAERAAGFSALRVDVTV